MFRNFIVLPARAWLAGLLVLMHLGVIAFGLVGTWEQTFRDLGVSAMDRPFGDFRVISAGVVSADHGLDPLVQNPADHLGRPLNYPRIWLIVGRVFPGDAGAIAAGLLLAAMFSATVAWLVMIQKTTEASVAICLLALCNSTWLALERGNTDLMIFVLLALAVFIPWRHRATLVGLAAVLKVYPVVACVLKALWQRTALNIGIAVAVIVYLWVILGDLVLISQTTGASGFLSFGMQSVILLFSGASLPTAPIYTFFAIGTLLAVGLAVFARFRTMPSTLERESMLLAGGLLIFCFIAGSNWDYRLIFLLLTVPYLLRPDATSERVLGWAAVGLMMMAANFSLLFPAVGRPGLVVNLAAKYLVYCILVFSVARILIHSRDVLSFRRREREQESPV